MPVRFHRLASQELRQAATAYELAAEGLGFDFVREVFRATRVIGEHPDIAEALEVVAMPGCRRFVMSRFPFLVVYVQRKGIVEILAVAHAKRRPRYWVRRIHRH